jgi:RNA polymerase sigma factor (sigma-70 family)
MPTAVLNGFADHLRRGLPADPRADGELVREYAATGSEAAFAELVRRFSPLVWGVCRRAVHDRQLAEDSFQATFLVFIRKAGSVRPNAVGGWLHAVAVHTSTRARAMADRRNARTRPLADHDPAVGVAEPTDADAVRALDEEVSRLPESLRAAVVLCELDGLSRKDAATRLGIAEGTLSSRLASARKRLAARLRGRGIALTVALAVASQPADAAPLVASTTSETVSALADGAVRIMFLTKLKLTAAGVLAVLATLGVGGWLLLPAPAKDPPQLTLKAAKPQPKPKEGLIAYTESTAEGEHRVMVVKPDGEEVARITGFEKECWPGFARLSRDGTRLAVGVNLPAKEKPADAPPGVVVSRVQVYDLESPGKPVTTLDGDFNSPLHVWGADNNTLYVTHFVWKKAEKGTEREGIHTVLKFDLATGKSTPVDLPEGHQVNDVSADGNTLLVNRHVNNGKDGWHVESYTADAGTLKLKRVTQASVALYHLSPDGTKAVGMKFLSPKFGSETELVVFDLKEGTETAVKMGDDDTVNLRMAVWSADGKKLLIERTVVDGVKNEKPKVVGNVGYLPKNKPEVTIRELDGSNPKPFPAGKWAGQFDWR